MQEMNNKYQNRCEAGNKTNNNNNNNLVTTSPCDMHANSMQVKIIEFLKKMKMNEMITIYYKYTPKESYKCKIGIINKTTMTKIGFKTNNQKRQKN